MAHRFAETPLVGTAPDSETARMWSNSSGYSLHRSTAAAA